MTDLPEDVHLAVSRLIYSEARYAHSDNVKAATMLTRYAALLERPARPVKKKSLRHLVWHEELSGMVKGPVLFEEQQKWVRYEDVIDTLESYRASLLGGGECTGTRQPAPAQFAHGGALTIIGLAEELSGEQADDDAGTGDGNYQTAT